MVLPQILEEIKRPHLSAPASGRVGKGGGDHQNVHAG
jgi:hypothetical protein